MIGGYFSMIAIDDCLISIAYGQFEDNRAQ